MPVNGRLSKHYFVSVCVWRSLMLLKTVWRLRIKWTLQRCHGACGVSPVRRPCIVNGHASCSSMHTSVRVRKLFWWKLLVKIRKVRDFVCLVRHFILQHTHTRSFSSLLYYSWARYPPPHKRKPLRIIPADLHRLETFPTVSKHSMELTTNNNHSATTSSPDLSTESQRHDLTFLLCQI